jgi:hypothetical protein
MRLLVDKDDAPRPRAIVIGINIVATTAHVRGEPRALLDDHHPAIGFGNEPVVNADPAESGIVRVDAGSPDDLSRGRIPRGTGAPETFARAEGREVSRTFAPLKDAVVKHGASVPEAGARVERQESEFPSIESGPRVVTPSTAVCHSTIAGTAVCRAATAGAASRRAAAAGASPRRATASGTASSRTTAAAPAITAGLWPTGSNGYGEEQAATAAERVKGHVLFSVRREIATLSPRIHQRGFNHEEL